jgi:hypothetical protein
MTKTIHVKQKTLSKLLLGAALATLVISTADAKVVGPPEVAWKEMTAKQKGAYMKAVVTPKMKPLFQAFDSRQFKKFTCETCHGKGAVDREFKMPSPGIKPLPGTPEAFMAKLKTEKDWPKWTDFMKGKVVPTMSELLAIKEFDPKAPDPKAFGCKNCHRIEGAK